ncbi:MAG: DMT family transporter [Hyphomicrobiaceae bacterium]
MATSSPSSTAPAASNAVLGVVLMSLAMLMIPLVDGLAKHLSGAHSPLFISWARYAVACFIVLPFAVVRYGRAVLPRERLGSHLLRTVFLMAAMTLYFLAIARIPLATAISAYFVGPILATVLAVMWLGERLTVRKILALVLGFAGAMLILRPDGQLEPGILLAMGSGAFFALYLIATRQASQSSDPLKTLVFQCLVGALLLTPQAFWAWSVPMPAEVPFFLAMGILSALSHILSITAFRYAEASTLAPLVYLELVASALVGFYVFGDLPGTSVWLGAAVIVAGGLLLLRRSEPS